MMIVFQVLGKLRHPAGAPCAQVVERGEERAKAKEQDGSVLLAEEQVTVDSAQWGGGGEKLALEDLPLVRAPTNERLLEPAVVAVADKRVRSGGGRRRMGGLADDRYELAIHIVNPRPETRLGLSCDAVWQGGHGGSTVSHGSVTVSSQGGSDRWR